MTALIAHRGLYIYRLDAVGTGFCLAAVRLPAPPRTRVRPAYAGLVDDLCLTPVPLRLDLPAPPGPHRWQEAGEHWLDLPAGPATLLRFRLRPGQRLSPRLLERLAQEASGW